MWGLVKVPGEWKQKQACPPLLDLSSRPAINTFVWRSQFQWHGNLSLPLRWATAGPLRLSLGSLQPDPKGWVAAVAFLPFVLFPSMRTIPASSPFQHFCHLPFFFFFSKGFIYTAFMLFCLMKTVWICAFQTAQKTDPPPFLHSRWGVCYVTPPKIDFDFSKVCSSQRCLPVSMHDRLRSYFQSLR